MTKDFWSVTVGPLTPDLYQVQFEVDGLMIADPGSSLPKPQRQVNTSLLEISGDPPTFIERRDVPHGVIRAHIMPFVTAHYRVRTDAKSRAAGLSMGGYQTVYTGFIRSDQFSALGVFSSGFLGEPQPLEQALQSPQKISANVGYLYVTTGSKDPLTGPSTKVFIARLDELKIPYAFEEYPDQIHSMDVWRPSLNKFIAKLFR